MSNEERYQALVRVITANGESEPWGIVHFGLLHEIAAAWGLDSINTGGHLRELSERITYYTRKLIKAGYPIEEYRIKSCAWSSRESWHVGFELKQKQGE